MASFIYNDLHMKQTSVPGPVGAAALWGLYGEPKALDLRTLQVGSFHHMGSDVPSILAPRDQILHATLTLNPKP